MDKVKYREKREHDSNKSLAENVEQDLNVEHDGTGTPDDYFSYARDIMPYNLIQIQPLVGYRFGGRLLITLRHDLLWRAETADAFYNSANGIGVQAGASDSRWLGQQTQLAVNYKPNPHVIIAAFYSRFNAGDVITDSGGDDRDYFYTGVNFLF